MTCDVCGGEINSGWSDEAARVEYEAAFGTEFVEGETVTVCHACYTQRELHPTPIKHHYTTSEYTDCQLEKIKRLAEEQE